MLWRLGAELDGGGRRLDAPSPGQLRAPARRGLIDQHAVRSHIRKFFSAHFKMVVLMNGHFACNVADRLLADMAVMPGKLMVHDISLLGSWQLPAMLTVCACRRRLAPETVRMFAPRTAEFALI